MTAAQDAAVLYFALHGTDASLTCQHLNDDDTRCGLVLSGLAHGDGGALCIDHVREEGGHLLDVNTLATLWLIRNTLDELGQTPESKARRTVVAQSNLESFSLKVAGFEPHAASDTIPAPPPAPTNLKHYREAKTRGHRR